MVREQQLSDKLIQRLLFEIRDGIFANKDALPPEVELAEYLGVGRNIIRECLTRLEREGWVTRKHGVGTLINKTVVQVKTRLDLNFELCQTLELSGKKAEIAFVKAKEIPASVELAKDLELVQGETVVRVARLVLADGKPAIYCVDYFAKKMILDGEFDAEDTSDSIFEFLQRRSGVEVVTNLAEIRAMPVTEEVAEALDVPLTCSMLFLGEIGYDLRSKPVLYSEEYYMDRVIRHVIVRKKI